MVSTIGKKFGYGAFIFLCLVAAQAANAQWTAILNLNNPSPYLSDWSSRRNTATLSVSNPNGPRAVKILADIIHNNELVAFTKPDKVEIRTLSPGQSSFFGDAIVPYSAIHFEDNIDQSTQRAGRIPDGTICVRVKVVDAQTTEVLAEDYKCVTIISYTQTYLLLPENEAVICKIGEHNVVEMNTGNPRPMFRWSPVVPAPPEPVRYQFKIFEVLPGQNIITSFRSARPLFERELFGMTELMWPVEYFYPEAGKRYVWSVRALDFQGFPLVSYQDGWATPFFFTVTRECAGGGVDWDGDGVPDEYFNRVQGEVVDIKTVEGEVVATITQADPSPITPEERHLYSGKAISSGGGPFTFQWFMRKKGAPKFTPLTERSASPNLVLAPNALEPNQTYQFHFVAEKNGAYGVDNLMVLTSASTEEPSGPSGGGDDATGDKTWEEGASQAEVMRFLPEGRSYVAGRFALMFDNSKNGGLIQKIEGGNIRSESVGDFSIQLGLGMPQPIYDWIQDSWNKKYTRKNGAIILADFNYSEKARREFSDALISEIQMPALDAASKDPCYMTVKLKPEGMKYVESDPNSKADVSPSRQKKWLPANFRLNIEGMEGVCKHVTKIESPSMRIKVSSEAGSRRQSIRVPGRMEYPNITFYIPESYGRDLFQLSKDPAWMKTPRNGTLEYLASDNTPLFTLTFKGLGIFKVGEDKGSAGSDKIVYTTVEMYCEDIKFSFSQAATQ